jgi:asparagine synthase (glutamine-hydrolysing)
MSAIAGVIEFSQQENPLRENVAHILGKLQHRGRQDEGYVFFQGEKALRFSGNDTHPKVRQAFSLPPLENAPDDVWLVLGHRLGSVQGITEPKAHQPFGSLDGKIWAVLDGEILNASQLSKELRNNGIGSETDSHVELILNGYRVWGESLLSRIEGSFSFLIYDQIEGKVFAARDPFGIKPFYYCHEEGVFAFGSELKSLFGLPFVSKKMSKSAVFDYLLLGESETHIQSIFRGLSELMPGSAMTLLLPKGNSKIWSYFSMATDSKIDRYSRNKVSTLAHRLRKSLVSNVGEHLSPGLPTAYLLSKDKESMVFPYLLKESIREMRAQERPDPSEIFSCIWQEGTLQEKDINHLTTIGKDLGVELFSSTCTFRDFSSNLLKVCHQQDVPFTNLDVFHQYRMLEEASAKGIKVLIEPSGGSQLFASNHRHFLQYLDDNLSSKNYSIFFENLMGFRGPVSEKTKMLFYLSKKLLFKTTSDDIKESMIRNNQEEFSYLKDNFKDRYFKNLDNKIKSMPESLNQLIASELGGSLVKEKLRTSDRNAQAFGIEIRHPFVSSRTMADPIIKASSVYKIREGQPSNLLLKAMRGVFPEIITHSSANGNFRSKAEQGWLRDASEELKSFITPDLDDFIDSKHIRNDWDKLFMSDDDKRTDFLWRVINLGIWRHVYFS